MNREKKERGEEKGGLGEGQGGEGEGHREGQGKGERTREQLKSESFPASVTTAHPLIRDIKAFLGMTNRKLPHGEGSPPPKTLSQ